MTTFAYANPGASFARSTVLLLAVAATSYVAGTLFHNPASPRDSSAAFAASVQAAEPNFRSVPGADGVRSAMIVEWGRKDGEVIEPRECDLANGISTACLFMD